MSAEIKGKPEEVKATFWRHHIENCERSGMSQAMYCKQHSLALATFCYWKRKLKNDDGQQEKPRFYPLTVQSAQARNQSQTSAGLSIHVTQDEFRVEIAEDFSASALKKLLTVLKQS